MSRDGSQQGLPPRQAETNGIHARVKALAGTTYPDLQAEWQRLFRSRPPKKLGRETLELAVAWRLQEREYGGLSPANNRQLAGLAESLRTSGDIAKARTVTLKRGSMLLREWNGEMHQVRVLERGFEWRGRRWRSLSAVAREITGTRWSGPRFFGLERGAGAGKAAATANRGEGDRG
jgi:Protein of unknown function (DUF2924)